MDWGIGVGNCGWWLWIYFDLLEVFRNGVKNDDLFGFDLVVRSWEIVWDLSCVEGKGMIDVFLEIVSVYFLWFL